MPCEKEIKPARMAIFLFTKIGLKEAFYKSMSKKVFKRNLRAEYGIECIAMSIMELVKERVSRRLYDDMLDYLLGFEQEMQLEIADNLLDSVNEGWEHYVGIRHIDQKMKCFYMLVDEEMGRNLVTKKQKMECYEENF